MNPAAPCSVCQQQGHPSRKCPELVKELETGFYKPAGGMPQGGGEDDENLNRIWAIYKAKWAVTHSLTLDLNTSSPLLCNPPKTF
jgi:hypothetical protein